MCRSDRGRGKVALEVVKRDVVADHIHSGVDAKVEITGCTRNATGGLGAVDDLLGECLDEVHGGESEELVCVESIGCDAGGTEIEVELDCDPAVAADVDGCGGCAEH